MKRHLLTFIVIAATAMLSWSSAQTARTDLFDAKKSQQELEVMRGIIGTTLNFVAREVQQRETGAKSEDQGPVVHAFGFGNNVNSFYFYGQGATFIIRTSRFAFGAGALAGLDDTLNHAMEQARMEIEAATAGLQAEAAAAQEEAAVAREAALAEAAQDAEQAKAATVPPPPPAPPAPAVAPAPPAPPAMAATPRPPRPPRPARTVEESRKRLAEAQDRVKERRVRSDKMRQKLAESIEQMKGYLVEAIANHGDSLTHVRPNEYINVVITSGGDDFGGDGRRDILSVQKSTITDYKAGRITLDAFRQKVLQYSE